MTLNYKLHHIGILCADPAASRSFYQSVLGHELLAQFYSKGNYDLSFLGSGSDLYLELIGRPFSADEEAYFNERGPGFHHLAFEVDDVDAAYQQLTAAGVRSAWAPDDFLFVRHCGVYDDSGIVIEILQEKEPLPRPSQQSEVEFLLHHFDIFSDDWRRTRQFYAQHFGFKSVFEYIYEQGGAFAYLADRFFDPNGRQAMIEVIGPPYVEPREFEFSAQFKTGMDHIGYVVADVDHAYKTAVDRGAPHMVRPYSEYGTTMCWVQDADGGDLELMLPVDAAKLGEAFRSGCPYRPAYPDHGSRE